MSRNIEQVAYCGYIFDTWEECPGYFDPGNKHRSRVKDVPSSLINKTAEDKANIETKNGNSDSSEYLTKIKLVHICRHCFKYTVEAMDLVDHEKHCTLKKAPPGKLVYKSNDYCMYKVDGDVDTMFCQCLCLFGKLFLDSKSIMFAVNGFEFFILTERHRNAGMTPRILGFFSKEKISWDNNNLGCLLVFPPFQKRGLGQLLIAYSYFLSQQTAQNQGSPERPLSKHGKASYYFYWLTAIAQTLSHWKRPSITIDDISRKTYIEQADIIEALRSIDAFTWTSVVPSSPSHKYSQQISLTKLYDWVNSHNVSLEPLIDKKHCLST